MALTADVIPMWTWVHLISYNWVMYVKGHLDARARDARRVEATAEGVNRASRDVVR